MMRILVWGGLAVSNAVAWAESVNIGALVSGATTLVGGVVMVGILAYRQINAVRREEAKKWEEFHAASLTTQLDAIKADTEVLRKSNHEIRNDLNNAKLRNAELQDDLAVVTARLMEVTERYHEMDKALARSNQQTYAQRDEIDNLRRALAAAHAQNTQKADETLKEVKEIKRAVADVQATQSGSSGERPTHPPDEAI